MGAVYFFADSIALYNSSGWWQPFANIYYVGAFNGDQEEFFDLFLGQSFRAEDAVRHLLLGPSTSQELRDPKSMLFLSGGSCERGMQALANVGVTDLNHIGGVAGLSAGAMVIMRHFIGADGHIHQGLGKYDGFLISVHDEENDWHDAREHADWGVLCIPSHGACIYSPSDHTVTAKLVEGLFIRAGEPDIPLPIDIPFKI